MRNFLHQLCLNVLIHSHGNPGHLEETRKGTKNGIGLGKRINVVGIEGFRRNGVGREGVCSRQRQGRGLMGWCQQARGAWVGSTHLDISFGPH